jgi:hypothetical protein
VGRLEWFNGGPASVRNRRGGVIRRSASDGNLAAVGHDTALYKQTLDKLGETEATISTLSSAIAKGTDEIEAAKEQLQVFVSSLTL